MGMEYSGQGGPRQLHIEDRCVSPMVHEVKSEILRLLERTPARYLCQRIKAMRAGPGQSDEAEILARLAVDCPRSFIECGFHPTPYNCIGVQDLPAC